MFTKIEVPIQGVSRRLAEQAAYEFLKRKERKLGKVVATVPHDGRWQVIMEVK